jgi:hypothetical protein
MMLDKPTAYIVCDFLPAGLSNNPVRMILEILVG